MHTYVDIAVEAGGIISQAEGWDRLIVTERVLLGGQPARQPTEQPTGQPTGQSGSTVGLPKGAFRKVCVEGVSLQTVPKTVYALGAKHDLLEVFVGSNAVLEKCAGWKVSSVRPDLTSEGLRLRKGTVSKVVHAHIYLTLDLAGYFNPRTRSTWIYNTRELLRLASKKSIVLALGTKSLGREEAVELLQKFQLKDKVLSKFFTSNPEQMLIRAAVKKYAHQGAIVQVQAQEPPLKAMVYRATKEIPNVK